jgi:hypothetical protein
VLPLGPMKFEALCAGLAAAFGGGWLDQPALVAPLAEVGPKPAPVAPVASGQLSAEEVEGARRLAHDIGEAVWSSTDAAALQDFLDAQLDDEEALLVLNTFLLTLTTGRFVEAPDLSSFIAALRRSMRPYGDKFAPHIADGMRIVIVTGQVMTGAGRRARTAPATPETAATESAVEVPESAYNLPLPLLRTLHGSMRAMACLAALADLVLSNRPPPRRWLLERVLGTWIENWLRFLQLAMLLRADDTGVPADLLKRAPRIDEEAMLAEHNARDAVFVRFLERAAEAR